MLNEMHSDLDRTQDRVGLTSWSRASCIKYYLLQRGCTPVQSPIAVRHRIRTDDSLAVGGIDVYHSLGSRLGFMVAGIKYAKYNWDVWKPSLYSKTYSYRNRTSNQVPGEWWKGPPPNRYRILVWNILITSSAVINRPS